MTSNLPHNKILTKTNVEANGYLMQIFEKMIGIIGLNVFDPNYRMGPRTWIVLITTHTLVFFFVILLFSDSPINVKLEAFCLTIIIYQGCHKLYTAIIDKNHFVKVNKFISDLHKQYMDDVVIAPALKKIVFYCSILFELMLTSYYCAALSYTIFPLLLWLQSDLLTTIFPIQIPFLDWHTPIGYICNFIHHIIVNFAGPTGIIVADIIFLYYVFHTIGLLEIFKYRLDHLDALLDEYPRDLEKVQTQLHECIKAHQDYISYINLVDKGHSQICLAQLVTSELALTFALFLTLWSKWIIGPFLALAGTFQLLEYCILGTVVTIQNDRAVDMIYGVKWYLLPAKQQQLIILMLLQAQNSPELNVGSFAKLNVETCMQVLKATYSYLMMMLEFLK